MEVTLHTAYKAHTGKTLTKIAFIECSTIFSERFCESTVDFDGLFAKIAICYGLSNACKHMEEVRTGYQFFMAIYFSSGFGGEGVVEVLIDFHELGQPFPLANLLTGNVEGDAGNPSVEVAFASEGGPSLPEGAGDFLIEVAEIVAASAGKVEAYLDQGALALAEHLQEISMLARFYFHSGCVSL